MLSKRELQDILISWITISVAFAWNLNPYEFLTDLPLYLIVFGTAFILHELGHKYSAHILGYPAEYRMWVPSLFFAVLLAVLTNGRFVFAAPGAVYVLGYPNRKDNGIISLAGPMVNLAIATLALAYLLFVHPSYIVAAVYYVNVFVGLFNMLPVYPLDGSKVLAWNPTIYFITFAAFLFLHFGFPVF